MTFDWSISDCSLNVSISGSLDLFRAILLFFVILSFVTLLRVTGDWNAKTSKEGAIERSRVKVQKSRGKKVDQNTANKLTENMQ